MPDAQVCRRKPVSKARLSNALGASWGRVKHAMGAGAFADAMEADPVTITRGIAGPSLPAAENLLNSLAADPTALQEVLALYGVKAVPLVAEPANDMALAANLGHGLAELIDRLRDGRRCHVDTAVLAPLFRAIIPQMQAIVDEDDARKVAA